MKPSCRLEFCIKWKGEKEKVSWAPVYLSLSVFWLQMHCSLWSRAPARTFPPWWGGFPQTNPHPHNPSFSIHCLCQVSYHSHTEDDEHSGLGARVFVREPLQCLEHTVESPELEQFKWEQGKIIVGWLIDGAGQGCPLRAPCTRRTRCKNREDRRKQGPQSLWNKAREHTLAKSLLEFE